MIEYYFLEGKTQRGPYTIEQLFDKGLTSESYVWTAGMEKWQKLKDFPELQQKINFKAVPPPPPRDYYTKIFVTEDLVDKKKSSEIVMNSTFELFIPSKKIKLFFIVWCSFHIFALLTSFADIPLFDKQEAKGGSDYDEYSTIDNRYYKPERHLWPFVWFVQSEVDRYRFGDDYMKKKYRFEGVFYNYDWTEFIFYVGGAFLIYFLIKNYKEKQFIYKK